MYACTCAIVPLRRKAKSGMKAKTNTENRPKAESEKTLERRLASEVRRLGGMAVKQTAQYHRGLPDRIVLMPHGLAYFAELKSTGRKPTKLQDDTMAELRRLGFPAVVIDGTEGLDAFLSLLRREQMIFEG